MAKEPKLRMMPWFPSDFIASTRHMLGPERLAFRELLDFQWINGGLPNDPKRLAQTLGISESEFLEVWPAFKEHFPKDPGNAKVLLNKRLERERLTSIELRIKASAKAKQAANARWQNASSNASGTMPGAILEQSPLSDSSSGIPIRSGSGERVSEGAPEEKRPMEPDEVPPPTRNVQASNGHTAHLVQMDSQRPAPCPRSSSTSMTNPTGKRKANESKTQARKTAYILRMIAAVPLSDAEVARFVRTRYEEVTAEDIHRVRLEHEQGNLGAAVR
jgi:uncharacterized protein YdaU (DUF1376 family)